MQALISAPPHTHPPTPTRTASPTDTHSEMHLQPEPLFNVPSDNVCMVAIEGTPDGRLFLAGRDGCLYEIIYQAVDGWFSKKCRKINHSISMVSFLVPSFLSFSEDGKSNRMGSCS